MQEPLGAFTWYAVNDHPSDKALYDFTLSVPAPWTGIANGDLLSTEQQDGLTVDPVAPGRAGRVVPLHRRLR